MVLQQVDDPYRSAGEIVLYATRDVLTRGVVRTRTHEVDAKFLDLELDQKSGATLQVGMRVTRCHPSGEFHETGGTLLTKLDAD